ncbi:MAG: hypothetical protein AB8H79_22555 [Myxococcota bacterium]
MRPVLVAILALPALFAGCDNSCQQVCDRMAKYAEECSLPVTKDDIEACKDAQAGKASADDRAVCREFNSKRVIEQEWDCDDMRAYWTEQTANAEDGGTDGGE